MSYKDLEHFKDIFKRDDFTYISNIKNIKAIITTLQLLNNVTIDPKRSKIILQEYLQQLELFFDWLKYEDINDLEEGFKLCKEILKLAILLYDNPKKSSIGRKKIKKNAASFKYSLKKILSGLRLSFDRDLIGKTRIGSNEIARYILNENEGFAKRYEFNLIGRHSPQRKLLTLNIDELKDVIKLLRKAPKGEKRSTRAGYRDLGAGGTLVRILTDPQHFKRDKVFYIFTMAEHITRRGPYQRKLDTTKPETEPFSSK